MVTAGGQHHLAIERYGGADAFLLPLMPRPLRLRIIARKILRHHGWPNPVPAGVYTFSLPGEASPYEIVSPGGAVRPFHPKAAT